jgi:hypothetical protein
MVDVEEFLSHRDSINYKYLGVILNEDNNHQIDLKEGIKMLIKHTSCYKDFLHIKIYLKN